MSDQQSQKYMLPPARKKRGCLTIGLYIVGGFFGLVILAGIFGKRRDPSAGAATDRSERVYAHDSFAEVAHLFGPRAQMTDLQQDEAWRQYSNKWVRWTVRAGDVRESLGTLRLQFKCGSESLILDGSASFADDQRANLLTVRPNDTVQIEGRLSDHGRILGLELSQASVSR